MAVRRPVVTFTPVPVARSSSSGGTACAVSLQQQACWCDRAAIHLRQRVPGLYGELQLLAVGGAAQRPRQAALQ